MGLTQTQFEQRVQDERLMGWLIVELLLDDLADRNGIERDVYVTTLRSADGGPLTLTQCDGCGETRPCTKQEVRLGDGEIDDVLMWCPACSRGHAVVIP